MNKLPISEELLAAIVGVIVAVLITLVPDLQPLEEHLAAIVAIFLGLILVKGGENIVKKYKGDDKNE